jgi:aspartyl-tRNA(Asn)/glutamyl-tRNA(Gln) amidotransferase subunit A
LGIVIDLDTLTITHAAELIAGRKLSATELLSAVIARIEETEPLVHAYASLRAEAALTEAKAADESRSRGPLHGIPFAVKDVICTRDLPTECGSRALAGWRPPEDAECVRSLREAGAILVGKHVTHEFALGQDVPPTRNPWRLTDYPGGSSAGSGASVAVGSSLAALGTDAGGSVRKPAALNGVVGFKPTLGLISRLGVCEPSGSLDHVATFTRTVEDAVLLLSRLAGPVQPIGGLRGVRLGICRSYFFGERLEESVREPVEEALQELDQHGAILVPIVLPSLELTIPAGFTLLIADAGKGLRRFLAEHPHELCATARRLIELGVIMPFAWVDAAQQARVQIRQEVRQAFSEAHLDALVTPTLPRTSVPLETMEISVDLPRYIPFTLPWNLTGQPALSVPCGFSPDGLPVGLQVIGKPFDEGRVLGIGCAYQHATDWHLRRPSLHADARL